MRVLLCLAALLGVTLASDPVYQPAPHQGCREDGDLVMDPVNRCQVLRCVMMEKKHGYDEKDVYKYFDVEKVMCPYKTINVHIQQPHGYQANGYPPHNTAPHSAGYGQPQQLYGHPRGGYGYQYHELEVQTGVDKYTHANYLRTLVKGEPEALCNENIHKPSEQCTDVHG